MSFLECHLICTFVAAFILENDMSMVKHIVAVEIGLSIGLMLFLKFLKILKFMC